MHTPIIRIFTALILIIGSAKLPAQNLVDMYQLAIDRDPVYRAAQANYRANKQTLTQARGALLPTIDATASKNKIDAKRKASLGSVSQPAGRAKYNRDEYTLTITQPIFNGAIFSGLKQAKAEVRRAEAEYVAAQQDLIARLAEAYFGVLSARDNLELALAERAAIAQQLAGAKGRLSVGLATITDVHDARARHQLAEAQVIEAQNKLADSRQALREITGISPAKLNKIGQNMPLIKPEPNNIKKWIEKANTQNMALMAQREAVVIAKQDVKIRRAGHIPTLNLVGTRNRSNSDGSLTVTGSGIESTNTIISLELNIPIFRGGRTSSETRQAIHRLEAARQQLTAVERGTERQIRSAFMEVSSGTLRINALKQAVVANESALKAKRLGFRAGIRTNLDVLDAQRNLFRAKRDYSDARYSYILNLLKLKQSTGTLGADDLRKINRWLSVR
jgi:outer membrane protein